ncbi:unnamed protein product [Mytilus coruscus]|uniref:C2H2-type domain-containing protein n=1 Tax=Mytilus coruscus TaxID=42192 RepID=A0A6J8E0M9_MYTCO|nr:unnamed protein product [Mytilus coruscus]
MVSELAINGFESICPRCRKTLYCGQSTSCSLAENFANKNCLMNSDNLGDTCSYQYEEQYNLRPHRLTSGYNFAVHASTSSSQETTSYFETESCCNTNTCFAEVSASIPGLSHYKFYSAKKHAQNIGLGVPAQTSKIPRSKINDGQLDHFLDFITSNHLIKDLPIGEKTLQLSTGELIQTPNVIRSIAPATIIRQYTQLCEDENIQPLGTSTMYKILTDCSASIRQSMEGLDYYISEGSRAFTDLTETVEQLDLTLDEKKKTLDNLVVAKHYLKTDFKSAIERHWDNPEAVLFKVFLNSGKILCSFLRGSVKFLTHVHIFEQPYPQDAATTGAILVSVFQNIPSVKRSTYGQIMLVATKKYLDHSHFTSRARQENKILQFCEAQDGKGPCDRKASHIKSAIKRHVNEGNNVTTAHQMKLFTDNGLQLWRAYDIGQGKLISWNSIIDKKIPVIQLFVHHDWSYSQFATVGSEVVDREDDDGDDDEEDDNDDNDNDDEDTQNDNYDKDTTTPELVPKKKRTIAKVFTCPEEGCTRSFKHSSSLDKHILLGNCNIKEEKNLALQIEQGFICSEIRRWEFRSVIYKTTCQQQQHCY